MNRFLLLLLCATSPIFLSSCSPLYVIKAAYEESKILLRKEPISEILQDEKIDLEQKEKLSHVLLARDFANSLSLEPGDSYTEYSELDREILAWVLLASKKTAFEPYTWWYPIVGRVPYKGYFEKEDADDFIASLEDDGYEVWLRTTEAFSTLGWFDDPVLSTTLKNSVPSIVNTVIHEIFHANIWIPGSVDFNESVANFVGTEGSVEFFEKQLKNCEDNSCIEQYEEYLKTANRVREFEYFISELLEGLYLALDGLYSSEKNEDDKLLLREEIFSSYMKEAYEEFPKMKILRDLNNAEIMQIYIYRKKLHLFRTLFENCHKDWGCFFQKLRSIDSSNPFQSIETMNLNSTQK